jgi:crotonobetainyl-CoA:carnitine CoA-transferase CaiB-like acyl-CoA transferase
MTQTSLRGQTLSRSGPAVPWLHGISVVAAGQTPTLDIASRLLKQLGADVSPETNRFDTADIVLVDRIAERAGLPQWPHLSSTAYIERVRAANRSVWVTASAFGLGSTRADARASDMTLLASGGILGHARIGDDWPPVTPPGTVALKLAGYVMAVSALHALHEFRHDGIARHVDLSAQAAVVATGLSLEMAHALLDCPDEGGTARYGAPSGFYDCLDGAVYVLVLEEHQWTAFRRVMSPALDDVLTLEMARSRADFVNDQLRTWTASRTVADCEALLQAAGVPCTAVNTLRQLAGRSAEAGRPIELAGADAPVVPADAIEVPVAAGVPRTHGAIPLRELRVLDAGHVLAVPLAAGWLGAMGAQVTKIEDPERLDIYRRRGPFAQGRPGLNRSAYFNQLNFCKTSVDVTTVDGTHPVHVEDFDVVVQNLSPRRAQALGVGLERILRKPSPTLAVLSSGFGRRGAWSGYRAYGHNVHAFAGLVAVTRDARGEMGDLGTPWADPLTSVAIAALVLAWALSGDRTVSTGIDVSMVEIAAVQIAELLDTDPSEDYAAPEVGGDFYVRVDALPDLVAVSLRSDHDVELFEQVAGVRFPGGLGKGQFLPASAPLDADLSDRLREAGLMASPVYTAPALAVDPFLSSTGLFQEVHSAALGQYRVTGLPWTFVGMPRPTLTAAPERPEA